MCANIYGYLTFILLYSTGRIYIYIYVHKFLYHSISNDTYSESYNLIIIYSTYILHTVQLLSVTSTPRLWTPTSSQRLNPGTNNLQLPKKQEASNILQLHSLQTPGSPDPKVAACFLFEHLSKSLASNASSSDVITSTSRGWPLNPVTTSIPWLRKEIGQTRICFWRIQIMLSEC